MKKYLFLLLISCSIMLLSACNADQQRYDQNNQTTIQQTDNKPAQQNTEGDQENRQENQEATPGRMAKGVIEGSLGYPSESIPKDMKVCAENITTKEVTCTETQLKDKKYTYGVGYTLDVAPGEYYVYAQTAQISEKDFKAYYSEYVTCGQKAGCSSHQPIKVTVKSGETVNKIDPIDWDSDVANKR